jgi:hypothetical protein
MSQSVTTLTNGGNGVLTRRSEFNIGIEDQLLDLEDDPDKDDDDRDLTLGRPDTGFHIGTARKVNGTSERSASGGNKNKKHFNFFQNKGKTTTDHQKEETISVSKTPRRVERSKSELGNEQHSQKKLMPHLSQAKPDLSETNKKILAHWNSGVERGMKLFQYGFAKTKWEEQQQQQQKRAAEQHAANDVTAKMSTMGASPMNKSCDGIQQSLQNVLTLKKHFDAAQIFSTLTLDGDKTLLAKKNSGNDSSKPVYMTAGTPDENDCLEKYLELDHGEFQFIDDSAATLTRGVSPPSPSVPMTKNLSISSLASEIFQELGQSGIGESSKPEMGSSRFRHHHQRRQRNLSSASLSAVPMETTNGRYEMSWNENGHQESNRRFQNNSQIELNVTPAETTKSTVVGDGTHRRQRRQRNLSSASMSAVILADETSQYMTSSWNGEKENGDEIPQRRPTFQNDSQLVASLIADQTLFLRHHQKRKQQRRRQQQWPVGKYPPQSKPDELSTAAGLLQQQLVDQASQHLILRRCSSLTQTYSDDQPDPDPPGSTRSSVLVPDRANENGTTRLSSPSKNIRFLYSGKYRPTFQQDPQQQQQQQQSQQKQQQQQPVNGNNNHDEIELKTSSSNLNQQSPWLLSNNLSSFARRRRSSSTSLHTYEDDFDDNCQLPNNNKKLNNGDSIPDYR